MISFAPLWKTMEKKNFTTYTLRDKYGMGGGTIQRLRKNMSVSTSTLDDLCNFLDCEVSDIVTHIKDKK